MLYAKSKLLLRRMPNTRSLFCSSRGFLQQLGIGLINATLESLLARLVKDHPTSWGQPIAYGISAYNYTLDDGHYHANLSAGDGSAATLDIVVGKMAQYLVWRFWKTVSATPSLVNKVRKIWKEKLLFSDLFVDLKKNIFFIKTIDR